MDLHVELLGDEIVVTRPGTDFMTAYRKRPDSPTLKLTRSWVYPHTTSPAVSEFRAAAFHAAVSKARELGSAAASRRQSWYVLVSRRVASRACTRRPAPQTRSFRTSVARLVVITSRVLPDKPASPSRPINPEPSPIEIPINCPVTVSRCSLGLIGGSWHFRGLSLNKSSAAHEKHRGC